MNRGQLIVPMNTTDTFRFVVDLTPLGDAIRIEAARRPNIAPSQIVKSRSPADTIRDPSMPSDDIILSDKPCHPHITQSSVSVGDPAGGVFGIGRRGVDGRYNVDYWGCAGYTYGTRIHGPQFKETGVLLYHNGRILGASNSTTITLNRPMHFGGYPYNG